MVYVFHLLKTSKDFPSLLVWMQFCSEFKLCHQIYVSAFPDSSPKGIIHHLAEDKNVLSIDMFLNYRGLIHT